MVTLCPEQRSLKSKIVTLAGQAQTVDWTSYACSLLAWQHKPTATQLTSFTSRRKVPFVQTTVLLLMAGLLAPAWCRLFAERLRVAALCHHAHCCSNISYCVMEECFNLKLGVDASVAEAVYTIW
jgi:hypothetical protein